MLSKKMLKKGDKIDYLYFIWLRQQKQFPQDETLTVALATQRTQAAAVPGTHSRHYATLYQYTN